MAVDTIYQGGPINWYIMAQSMYEPSHGVSCLSYNAQLPRRLAAANLPSAPNDKGDGRAGASDTTCLREGNRASYVCGRSAGY